MKELTFPSSLAARLHPSHLIDSLPYCDQIEPEALAKAVELVQQEMQSFEPPDYLEGLYEASSTNPSKRLEGDYRFSQKTYSLGQFDREQAEDQIKKALILKGHAERRLSNLSLYKDYATEGWEEHLKNLEAYISKQEHDLAMLQTRATEINTTRKTQQLDAQHKLEALQSRWRDLTSRNRALQEALKRGRE